jgi:hypothetical protein
LNAPGSFRSPSIVVSGRLHSSFATVTCFFDFSPVALSVTSIVTVIGVISSLSLPDCWKAAVRCCDASATSSCASRDTL